MSLSRWCRIAVLALAVAAPTRARADGGEKPASCGGAVRWVCCPKWKTEPVTRPGFDVQCEHICVPRVRLPWQDDCTPRCARVLAVHRLKKETIECGERCVLTWEAKAVCARCLKPVEVAAPSGRCGPSNCAAP